MTTTPFDVSITEVPGRMLVRSTKSGASTTLDSNTARELGRSLIRAADELDTVPEHVVAAGLASMVESLAAELQRHCSRSMKHNWSPAFDGFANRPMPPITGVFCEEHCTVTDSADDVCPGALEAARRALMNSGIIARG